MLRRLPECPLGRIILDDQEAPIASMLTSEVLVTLMIV